MSNQQVKSLRKSNEELKKLLASARSDIKSLEERVGAQEARFSEGYRKCVNFKIQKISLRSQTFGKHMVQL